MNPVTETELKAKAVAPRVTLDYLTSLIAGIHYFTAADGVDGDYLNTKRAADAYNRVTLGPLKDDKPIEGTPMGDLALLTFCVIRLRNGFTVHGTSACADPANYDREIGQRLAHQNAMNQIWPLLGYELKTQLYEAKHEPAPLLVSHVDEGPLIEESPHRARLRIEYDELQDKAIKLAKFITTDTFIDLRLEERLDLIGQSSIMDSYLDILGRRIARG